MQRHQELDHGTPVGTRGVGAPPMRLPVDKGVDGHRPPLLDDLENPAVGRWHRCDDESQPLIAQGPRAQQCGSQPPRALSRRGAKITATGDKIINSDKPRILIRPRVPVVASEPNRGVVDAPDRQLPRVLDDRGNDVVREVSWAREHNVRPSLQAGRVAAAPVGRGPPPHCRERRADAGVRPARSRRAIPSAGLGSARRRRCRRTRGRQLAP